MTPGTRNLIRAGVQMAAQHPGLILWYLQNRVRTGALLPLELRFGQGKSLGPRFVTLKPTLRCNLRCEFCRFVANGDVFGKADWLELAEWKRVVDQVAPYGPYLCLTGGEPTLYPALPELIAHIKSHRLFCVLTTNGTMLDRVAPKLIAAPPDLVILSIDGPREVHDRVRMIDGAFERARRGALRLAEVRREAGKKAPHLILNAAITGHTWETARRVIGVAREFGAAALNFQHFWFMTRPMVEAHNHRWGDCFPLDFDRVGGTATTGVDPDALFDVIQRLRHEDHGLPITVYPDLSREGLRTYYGNPEQFTHPHTPDCAWISTDIMPNGDVSPCFELVCGNLREQTFAEIWNNATFRAHRERLAQHGPYPVCARCCAYFRHD